MIETLIITALICTAINQQSKSGGLLYFIDKPLRDFKETQWLYHVSRIAEKSETEEVESKQIHDLRCKIAYNITKPLYNCLPCMASLYGLCAVILVCSNIMEASLFIVALCGLNTVLSKIVN